MFFWRVSDIEFLARTTITWGVTDNDTPVVSFGCTIRMIIPGNYKLIDQIRGQVKTGLTALTPNR